MQCKLYTIDTYSLDRLSGWVTCETGTAEQQVKNVPETWKMAEPIGGFWASRPTH